MAEFRRSRLVGLWFILPSLLGVMAFSILPFCVSLMVAFTEGTAVRHFAGLKNFYELFNNPAFLLSLKNTCLFLAIGLPILLVSSLFVGLHLTQKPYGFLRWTLLLPFALPAPAMAQAGVKCLDFLGVSDLGRLNPGAPFALAIALFVLKNVGYMTILFYSSLCVFSREYQEAFRLDSSSLAKYGQKIAIPLLMPMIFFALILAISRSFQVYRELYIIYSSTPPTEIYMLQNFMNNNFQKLNLPRLSTASLITISGLGFLVFLYLGTGKVRNLNE